MGGSETVEWADALEASFEAAVAREEDVAAADLAFSLRQDVDLREAVGRSDSGWALMRAGGARHHVDEVGRDYVCAGPLLVRSGRATLMQGPGPSPTISDRTFLEVLGAVCRRGAVVTLEGVAGRLVRVARDHVAVQRGDAETMVGLDAVERVRLEGDGAYSASRGFSG